MKMSRVWAMPTKDTFDCKPIGELVRRYLGQSEVSVDPFARNKRWATYTNDLDPRTLADWHMDARDFLEMLCEQRIAADLIIFDPPYSPRQIKECYDGIGLKMRSEDAWRTNGWTPEKDLANTLLVVGGVFLYFGWDSVAMGKGRGFEIEEMLLVCHGPGHNDTICTVERKIGEQARLISDKCDLQQ